MISDFNKRKSLELKKEVQKILESKGFKTIIDFKTVFRGRNLLIDLIAINKKGVYLITTRNLNAVLTGEYKDKVWYADYEDNGTHEIKNSMKALYVSSLAIVEELTEFKIRPLTTTIFGNETKIKLRNAHPYSVLKINSMARFLESPKFKERLNNEEVDEIFSKLNAVNLNN